MSTEMSNEMPYVEPVPGNGAGEVVHDSDRHQPNGPSEPSEGREASVSVAEWRDAVERLVPDARRNPRTWVAVWDGLETAIRADQDCIHSARREALEQLRAAAEVVLPYLRETLPNGELARRDREVAHSLLRTALSVVADHQNGTESSEVESARSSTPDGGSNAESEARIASLEAALRAILIATEVPWTDDSRDGVVRYIRDRAALVLAPRMQPSDSSDEVAARSRPGDPGETAHE